MGLSIHLIVQMVRQWSAGITDTSSFANLKQFKPVLVFVKVFGIKLTLV